MGLIFDLISDFYLIPGNNIPKSLENGTSCSSLGTQTYGVELGLVDLVSG